jgi:predicted membrane protein
MKLVRGYKGRVFIFGALNYLFAVVFTIVSVILFLFVFGIIVEIYETNFHHGPSALIDTAAMIMIYAGLLTAKTMVKPIYVIALTFLYFDLRIRKEGYDIEKMMEKAGLIITSATSGINSTKLIEEGAE